MGTVRLDIERDESKEDDAENDHQRHRNGSPPTYNGRYVGRRWLVLRNVMRTYRTWTDVHIHPFGGRPQAFECRAQGVLDGRPLLGGCGQQRDQRRQKGLFWPRRARLQQLCDAKPPIDADLMPLEGEHIERRRNVVDGNGALHRITPARRARREP